MAWNPNHIGLLATGGGDDDNIIRLWNIKDSENPLVHTMQCNFGITSLTWRKGTPSSLKDKEIEDINMGMCEELISTHWYPNCEIKLWQVNKYFKKADPTFTEDDERKSRL